MDESQLRERFCDALRQLWTRGMVVGADGMLCCEVHRRRYLTTPVGSRRIDLRPADLICVDIGGENVQGGPSIPPKLWQPHRDLFQTHADPAKPALTASALVEPANVMALLSKNPGIDRLELGPGDVIPVTNDGAEPHLREVLAETSCAIISGTGLVIAAADLPGLLNRIERIDHDAAIRLAAGGC